MNLTKDKLKKYLQPENFFNRDLSWIEFNRRVMQEAFNPDLPLLDKIKFISIFFSNLDEHYMIRVSGIREQIKANIIETRIDGMTPIQEIREMEKEVQPMIHKIYSYWNEEIVPSLRKENVSILDFNELSGTEKEQLNIYFQKEIYPVLTPLAFDPGRPFPHISNLSISFAILIKKSNGEKHFARVKIPNILPRLLRIEDIVKSDSKQNGSKFCAKYIWLEDLIKNNLYTLFPGVEILSANRFRIIRDTDLEIQEDEADDLLELIEENIKQRKFGIVVLLEIERETPDFMLETLSENLELTPDAIHYIDGPLGLSAVMALYDLPLPHLKEKSFHPVAPKIFEEADIFQLIQKGDIFLQHPFDSFAPVIDFIKIASQDPEVLAIKQTLYRVGPNSPIIKYLIEAAERKKQVAVLVELKARFDEENNIFWARELEKAGVHVVYGLVGLKTHSKMTLIVRKETDGVKRYVHLGTGNYNSVTARIYTDLSLFSADEELCADVSEIFNFLTGYSEQKKFRKLFVAPIDMREKFIKLIDREICHAKEGRKAHLIFKMNSLVDTTLITAMYEASNNGVKIDLIIRGICCLVPGIPGLSENIKVISIVGRFLEHSRIYYFYNNGKEEIYSGSADMMQRNLDRRVETIFPIEDPKIKRLIIKNILEISLKDNVKARILHSNGKYDFITSEDSAHRISLQEWSMLNTQVPQNKSTTRKVIKD
ncbi:MAG: polyphosphate kinase 1 [bacterium]